MLLLKKILLGCLAFAALAMQGQAQSNDSGPNPANVVVVANRNVPASVEIARYYMQRRGIPEKNLLFVEASGSEEIIWSEFTDTLFNPLRQQLLEKGWIDGVLTGGKDANGILEGTFAGHKIDFLVTVYGVPVKTTGTEELTQGSANDPVARLAAAVDSELCLLPVADAPANRIISNSLFSREVVIGQEHHDLMRVARLDGPDVKSVKALVDNALLGEKFGLRGRAYIDFGGRYQRGDTWMTNAGIATETLGFETVYEPTKGKRFLAKDRFDAAAIYFGWYTFKAEGPFLSPDFRFPPGAVAAHLHSYSGYTVRHKSAWWVGPMINRGVTITFGNAYEPSLTLVHRYDLFLEGLAQGKTAGEAAYFALPALGWRTFMIGDPLYRPFAKTLDAQIADAVTPMAPGDEDRDPWQPYAVIRQMYLHSRAGDNDEAIKLGQAYLDAQKPNPLPLVLTLKDFLKAEGRVTEAIERLEAFARIEQFPASLHPAAMEAARFLNENGKPASAFAIMKAVIEDSRLTDERAFAWLPEAITLAERTGASDTARTWKGRQKSGTP
ncbi:MAG: TIGR03790 family protein [Opitutales bacterium]